LGGKSAAVICDDADLDQVIAGLRTASFNVSGQACIAQTRILAPRGRYAEVVDALSLRQTVIEVGLDYNVGTGGSRLSSAERQKAALARAVLKRPDLLILNEATSALDGQAQSRVTKGLKEEFTGRGILWVLHRASLARNFDRVLVLSNGKLQEQGTLSELDGNGSLMSLLIAAE